MSYILDALRKADAQRARDPVRGIHAQPLRSSDALSSEGGLRPWHIAAALGVAAVLSVAAWFLLAGREDTGPAGEQSVASNPAQMRPRIDTPMPAPAAMPSPSRPPVQSAAPAPAPATVVGNVIQPPPSQLPPPTEGQLAAAMPPSWPAAGEDPRSPRNPRQGRRFGAAMEAIPPQPQTQSQTQPVAPPVAPTVVVAAPGAPPSINVPGAGVAVPPAPSMSPASPMPSIPPMPGARPVPATTAAAVTPPAVGLPPDAPKLAINGGVYSTNKAQRMLIVNGQVYNEGSEVAAGVVLDEIRNKTAVLRYRGSRYTVAY